MTGTSTPACEHALAGGPLWDAQRERIAWVDLDGGELLVDTLRPTTSTGASSPEVGLGIDGLGSRRQSVTVAP